MESRYQYRLSKRAEQELDDILSYIAVELSNPKAAYNWADSFEKAVDEACFFPESGMPIHNEFLSIMEVRKKIIGNYIMYYLPVPEEETIYILRIVYGKRNIDEILRVLDL